MVGDDVWVGHRRRPAGGPADDLRPDRQARRRRAGGGGWRARRGDAPGRGRGRRSRRWSPPWSRRAPRASTAAPDQLAGRVTRTSSMPASTVEAAARRPPRTGAGSSGRPRRRARWPTCATTPVRGSERPTAARPRSASRRPPPRSPARDPRCDEFVAWAHSHENVSCWPPAADSAIGIERTVVSPSRSLAAAALPAAGPVTSAEGPDGTVVGWRRGPPARWRAGLPRDQRAFAGAVSVPSGFAASPGRPPGRRRTPRSGHRARPRRAPTAGTTRARRGRARPPCCGRSRSRSSSRRVVAVRQLERVREDAVHPVLVVARGPGADVQVAALLGPVAVGRGHVLADGRQRRVILRRHVGRDVRHRVAVRPHDEAPVLVERDRDPDLLAPADDAGGEEVAHGARLGRGERVRPMVRDRLRVASNPARDAPVVAVVAIEVGADRWRAAFGCRFLRQ